jgi:dual specificity MAP kinase phosphatase
MSTGLSYSKSFLDTLPHIPSQCSSKNTSIRSIDPAQFAQLHGRHILATGKPGLDATLFPYLHGVEHGGRNMQEYFSIASGSKDRDIPPAANVASSVETDEAPMSSIPAYRGLVWVACDEGAEAGRHYVASDGLDDEMLVDDDELNNRRPSDASTASVSSGFSLLRSSNSTPSPTSTEMDLGEDVTMMDEVHIDHPNPVLIPCSLKPSDILSNNSDEFLAPKVPELVSLRNFGIQVVSNKVHIQRRSLSCH